jgi:large subunit ribosomal protein L5
MKANNMRNIEIEKVVLSMGALAEELDASVKLLELLSGRKAIKTRAKKRIPNFNIRPGLEIGCKVTIRGKKAESLLKNLLLTVNNTIKAKQINDQDFSFGIAEYIEIPGMEYQRNIGMKGLKITVVFTRKGKRIELKKIKKGSIPQRQKTTKKEIVEFLKDKYKVEILEGKK